MNTSIHSTGIQLPVIDVSILSAKSVTLTWNEAGAYSLPVIDYSVSLARSSSQVLCPNIIDQKPPVTLTGIATYFEDLQEFSTYDVTILTTYVGGRLGRLSQATSSQFFTLSTGKFTVDPLKYHARKGEWESPFLGKDNLHGGQRHPLFRGFTW